MLICRGCIAYQSKEISFVMFQAPGLTVINIQGKIHHQLLFELYIKVWDIWNDLVSAGMALTCIVWVIHYA